MCLLAAGQSAPSGSQAIFKVECGSGPSRCIRPRSRSGPCPRTDSGGLHDSRGRHSPANFSLCGIADEDPVKPSERTSIVAKASADVQTNEIARTPEGRLFVLVLDDAMIPQDPQMAATAKKIAETAIDRLSPGDQMAVVFTVNSKGAQNFTGDRARLLSAVSTFKPGYATHLLGWDTAVWNDEKKTYERVADQDDGLRAGLTPDAGDGRRFPHSCAATEEGNHLGQHRDVCRSSRLLQTSCRSALDQRDDPRGQTDPSPAGFRRCSGACAKRTSRSIPSILAGLAGWRTSSKPGRPGPTPSSHRTRNMSLMDDWFNPRNPPKAMDLSRKVASVNLDFLKTVAENTGGLAITDTNDLAGGIDRIFAENSAYYLLGLHRSAGPSRRLASSPGSEGQPAGRDGAHAERLRGCGSAPGCERSSQRQTGAVGRGSHSRRPGAGGRAADAGGGRAARSRNCRTSQTPSSRSRWDSSIASSEATSQTLELELRAFTTEGRFALGERRTAQATLRPRPPGSTTRSICWRGSFFRQDDTSFASARRSRRRTSPEACSRTSKSRTSERSALDFRRADGNRRRQRRPARCVRGSRRR